MRLLTVLSALTVAAPALAQDPPKVSLNEGPPTGFGLGIVIGEPTGLTMAVRADSTHAVQAHASWSFARDYLRFNVDYLLTVVQAEGDGFSVPVYVGLGGLLGLGGDNVWLGARVPVGVAIHPTSVALEPFLEVVPGLLLVPESSFNLEAALGVRYYF